MITLEWFLGPVFWVRWVAKAIIIADSGLGDRFLCAGLDCSISGGGARVDTSEGLGLMGFMGEWHRSLEPGS